jgi:hypothetical protein
MLDPHHALFASSCSEGIKAAEMLTNWSGETSIYFDILNRDFGGFTFWIRRQPLPA